MDLEDVEGIGEGEKRGRVGGERKELFEGSSVLGENGVGEAV